MQLEIPLHLLDSGLREAVLAKAAHFGTTDGQLRELRTYVREEFRRGRWPWPVDE